VGPSSDGQLRMCGAPVDGGPTERGKPVRGVSQIPVRGDSTRSDFGRAGRERKQSVSGDRPWIKQR
jgi:hypothetical protein